MRLQGEVPPIPGGDRGIGFATAKRFTEGANVAITGRNQRTLDAAALQLAPEAVGLH